MDSLAKLLGVLIVPLTILNVFGGIVSGIWLAVLGEWGLIGFGILMLIFSGMFLGLVLAPGVIFALPAAAMLEKGNKLGGYFFGLLSNVYTVGILTAWCIAVLIYYINRADSDSLVPILIWSYGVATGPIMWLAQKEQNEYAMITTFFVELAYVMTILAILFVGVSLPTVMVLFGAIMTVGLIVQFSVAYLAQKSQASF